MVVDGGPIQTFDVASALSEKFPNIKAVRLNKNYGQHAATLAGVSISNSELILTMDDDGQHPASEIALLLTQFTNEHDLLYGVPHVDEHHLLRNLSSRAVKWFLGKFLKIPNISHLSSFRVFRRSLLSETEIDRLAVPFVDILLFWNTDRIYATRIQMEKRSQGKTNYSFGALVKYSVIMATSYSTRPLRLASLVGIATLILTICFSITLTALHFLGQLQVPGFASLCILISGVGAIQLISLGLIGEYVGVIHTKLLGRPTFKIGNVK